MSELGCCTGQPTGVTVLTRTRPAAKPIPTQRVRVNDELEKNTPLGIPATGIPNGSNDIV